MWPAEKGRKSNVSTAKGPLHRFTEHRDRRGTMRGRNAFSCGAPIFIDRVPARRPRRHACGGTRGRFSLPNRISSRICIRIANPATERSREDFLNTQGPPRRAATAGGAILVALQSCAAKGLYPARRHVSPRYPGLGDQRQVKPPQALRAWWTRTAPRSVCFPRGMSSGRGCGDPPTARAWRRRRGARRRGSSRSRD